VSCTSGFVDDVIRWTEWRCVIAALASLQRRARANVPAARLFADTKLLNVSELYVLQLPHHRHTHISDEESG